MSGMIKVTLVGLALAVIASTAQAQTKPAVTSLGPNFPKTEMFVGNSFFYYNNGMPGHVSLLEKAADPEHKSNYRATGTYLAACVTFAALTGRSPVGYSYHAGLDEPTAKFLQEVAWETVQDYYGK